MRFDPKTALIGLDGKPVQITSADGDALGTALIFALNTIAPAEGEVSGQDRWGRYLLAKRVHEAMQPDEAAEAGLDVTAEEVVLLKRVTGQLYAPLVVGAIWTLIDPPAPV